MCSVAQAVTARLAVLRNGFACRFPTCAPKSQSRAGLILSHQSDGLLVLLTPWDPENIILRASVTRWFVHLLLVLAFLCVQLVKYIKCGLCIKLPGCSPRLSHSPNTPDDSKRRIWLAAWYAADALPLLAAWQLPVRCSQNTVVFPNSQRSSP